MASEKNEAQLKSAPQETNFDQSTKNRWKQVSSNLKKYFGKSFTFIYKRISPAINQFFKALFDLSFNNFFTLKLIEPTFLAGVIILALIGISDIWGGFLESAWVGIYQLFVSSLVFFFQVILFRVALEVIIVVFRIREDLKKVLHSKQPSEKAA